MATYKSEVLHQRHDVAGVRRPRSHYVLGRLPRWARLAAPMARLNNRMMKSATFSRPVKWMAGIDQRRSVPTFASTTLQRAARARPDTGPADVWIWADSFTNHFFPASGHAALKYFEAQGVSAHVITEDACCGLTWITTGQLDAARRISAAAVQMLLPYVRSGVPVIALEPSCLATMRSDALELNDGDDARVVADGLLSFAEGVERLRLRLPDLTGVSVLAQPHCHQSAVIGWDTDRRLLERAGATVHKVSGCCGLAGNFGVEKGHYEVSVAVAETNLLPAVRNSPDAILLADGMSCRVQLQDLAGAAPIHLAELFAKRT